MKIKKFFTFLGWPLLFAPVALLWLGIACNSAATGFNGGQMPVINPVCATDPDKINRDYIHVCADSNTHLKFLVDRFPANDSIQSTGDFMQAESDVLYKPCYLLWAAFGIYFLIKKEKFYLE